MDAQRAVVLDGARADDPWTELARNALTEGLQSAGVRTEILPLWELEIAPCTGCFGCWVQTPGVCVIDDAGQTLAEAVIGSDVTVFLTPVTFGGYSAELKSALDRMISLVSPLFTRVRGEIHHRRRYRIYPRLLALGLLEAPHAEEEAVFGRLVERNAVNLWCPGHAAGVACADDGEAALRATLDRLLAQAVVRR